MSPLTQGLNYRSACDSRQVCNLLFLAFQIRPSSPGASTTAGEVCCLRLPCYRFLPGLLKHLQTVTNASLFRAVCKPKRVPLKIIQWTPSCIFKTRGGSATFAGHRLASHFPRVPPIPPIPFHNLPSSPFASPFCFSPRTSHLFPLPPLRSMPPIYS